jgi:hypothetical protein
LLVANSCQPRAFRVPSFILASSPPVNYISQKSKPLNPLGSRFPPTSGISKSTSTLYPQPNRYIHSLTVVSLGAKKYLTMAIGRLLIACAASIAFAAGVKGHGGGAHQKPIQVDPDADWATKHMAGQLGSLLKYCTVLTVKRGTSHISIRSSILLLTPRL